MVCTQNLITRFFGMNWIGPDPFGAPLVVIGEEAQGNPFRFSTKYADDEGGLVYYGFRYMAPGMGRWLSRDSIGEASNPNLFLFCVNAPTIARDAFGLFSNQDCIDHVNEWFRTTWRPPEFTGWTCNYQPPEPQYDATDWEGQGEWYACTQDLVEHLGLWNGVEYCRFVTAQVPTRNGRAPEGIGPSQLHQYEA